MEIFEQFAHEPANPAEALVDVEHLQRVKRFLYHEATLMDEHQYDAWLNLWHGDDILYWVPCNSDDQDPRTGVAIIYDDRSRLEERKQRLKDKVSHAFRPGARLVRIVSNVVPLVCDGDELMVASRFVLGEIRVGVQNTWFGKSLHRIVEVDGQYRLRAKKVMLLNIDEPMPNLTFLV